MSRRKRQDDRRPVVSGMVWLGIGVYLLLMQQEMLPTPDESWPVIIIIVGLALIVGGVTSRPKTTSYNQDQPMS